MKILLIEDDDLDARAIERQLRRLWNLEHELTRARDLTEGLAKAGEDCPDVAFLDLRLPDSQGLDGVPKLVERMPGRPVKVRSGDYDAGKALPPGGAGAGACVKKGDNYAQ